MTRTESPIDFTTYRDAAWSNPHEQNGKDWCPIVYAPFRPVKVKLTASQKKYKTEQGIITRAAMRRKR